MAEKIYIRNASGELEPVEEKRFETEAILETLVAQHPELLAGDQMHPHDPLRWILIKPQMGIEGWAVDLLLLDQYARPTLVEVKRGENREIRRIIVGQMLDYAATAASVWSERNLRQIFEQSSGDPDYEIRHLIGASDEPDVDAFWEQVATNLAANRLRLLFVADEIPPELERVVKFLNGQTRDTLEVLAVEVKQYPGQFGQALVSRVIGQANTPARLDSTRNVCLCGCGRGTKGRFYPGDDSKLKSWLANAENGKISRSDGNLSYAAERCRVDPALFCGQYKSSDIIRLAKVQEEHRLEI